MRKLAILLALLFLSAPAMAFDSWSDQQRQREQMEWENQQLQNEIREQRREQEWMQWNHQQEKRRMEWERQREKDQMEFHRQMGQAE